MIDKELSEQNKDFYTYVFELRERIIKFCILANQALDKAGEKQGLYANRNPKLRTLKANDKVLILLPEKQSDNIVKRTLCGEGTDN